MGLKNPSVVFVWNPYQCPPKGRQSLSSHAVGRGSLARAGTRAEWAEDAGSRSASTDSGQRNSAPPSQSLQRLVIVLWQLNRIPTEGTTSHLCLVSLPALPEVERISGVGTVRL